jgi:hypothetical protein
MSLEDHLCSSNKTSITSPNSAHGAISIKVEEGIDIDTTEQMIPVPISFPPVKAEQDEVSYMSLRPFLDAPISRNACCPLLPPSLRLSNISTVMHENFFLFGLCESIARKFAYI